jgi:hypothetical protein
MEKILFVLLMTSTLTFGAAIKPGGKATVTCDPCPAVVECPPLVECPAPVLCATCPVVEQPVCPAATVLPQPVLLIDPVGDAGADSDNPSPHLVGPAVQKKKLKEWQKWTIGIAGGLIVGAILQHQWESDDEGDTHKKVIIYPPDDDDPPEPPDPTGCWSHGKGHGHGCPH